MFSFKKLNNIKMSFVSEIKTCELLEHGYYKNISAVS